MSGKCFEKQAFDYHYHSKRETVYYQFQDMFSRKLIRFKNMGLLGKIYFEKREIRSISLQYQIWH